MSAAHTTPNRNGPHGPPLPPLRLTNSSLVIIGFKASGKSTVGRALAQRLGKRFRDLDDLILERARRERGFGGTCRELFLDIGERGFRRIESDVLRVLPGQENIVLATGGGAPMTCSNHELLRKIGTIVYIRVKPEVILARLQEEGMPAYLSPEASLEDVIELWKAPDAVHWNLAEVKVDATELTPEQTVGRIIDGLGCPANREPAVWSRNAALQGKVDSA